MARSFTVHNAEDAKILLAMHKLGVAEEPTLIKRALSLLDHLDLSENRAILNTWIQDDPEVGTSVLAAITARLNSQCEPKTLFEFLKLALLPPSNLEINQELIDLVWARLAEPEIAPDAASLIALIKKPATNATKLIESLVTVPEVALPVLSAWLSVAIPQSNSGDLNTVFEYFSRALRTKRSTETKLCLKIIEVLEEGDSKWARYTALVGIAVVDASSNQLLDAFDVFRAMLDSTTSVPAPKWKVALVEALFDSMLTPMRLTAAKLMLSLDTKSLQVFREAPEVAARQVIPQLCLPQYFRVDTVSPKCQYAEILEDWMHKLVNALGTSELASSLLTEYLNATVFKNARVYAPPVALVLNSLTSSASAVFSIEAQIRVAEAISLMNETNRALASKPLFASLIKLVVAQIRKNSDDQNKTVFGALPLNLPREHYIELAQVRPDPSILPKSVVLELFESTGALMGYAHEELLATGQLEYPTLAALLANRSQPRRGGCHSLSKKPPSFNVEELNLTDLGRLQLQALELRADPDVLSIECTSSEMDELMMVCRLRSPDAAVLELFAGPKTVRRPALLAEALRAFFKYAKTMNKSSLSQVSEEPSSNPWVSLPEGYLLKLYKALRESLLRPTHREAMLVFVNDMVNECKDSNCDGVVDTYAAIISDCSTRRGILVPLVKTVIQKIGLSPQALAILIRAYRLLYLDSHTVRLESFVAAKNRSLVQGAENPEEIEDRLARVLILDHLVQARLVDSNEVCSELLFEPIMFPTKTKDRVDGNQQRIRILTYQLVLALQCQPSSKFSQGALGNLFKALDAEGSTRARIYIVWLLARAAWKDHNVLDSVLQKLSDLSSPPRVVSSLIRVCLLVSRVKPDITPRIVESILPFTASSKVIERHAAVAAIYQLVQEDFYGTLTGNMVTMARAVAARSAPQGKGQHRRGPVATWDITDLREASIAGGISSQVLEPNDSAPDCFLTENDFRLAGMDMSTLGVFYESSEQSPSAESLDIVPHDSSTRDDDERDMFGIQKKSDGVVERTPLIVVATLCDRLPNLGGICRLCDALGVGKLVLNDMSVTKTTDFKSTAMTAERWQPMETVSGADLLDYLLQCKKEGYTIIGLEQTDTSRKLDTTLRFPDKTVLLIGRERLGIPSELLLHLDWCVEIEQRGVVRSMNVQTATAVLVHSYNNQCDAANLN